MYHSIIIEESLKDKHKLDKYRILRTKVSERWHLHVVEIDEPKDFINRIQNIMVTDKPYYFHLYDNNNFLVVVFKDKVFNMDSNNKDTWLDAQNYGGKKLNIPAEELDFAPNNFSDEDVWYNQS